MHNRKYYLIQDGQNEVASVKEAFSSIMDTKDTKLNKNGIYYNFVGFIITDKEILVSFPKHTFTNEDLEELSNKKRELTIYFKILFNCIIKAAVNKDVKYDGVKDELNSNYPFLEFREIYHYYKNYGLFTNEKMVKKFGYNGRISWKDTINKSPKIIHNNNLLFMPMVIKQNVEQHVFVSKCMAYAINYTLEKFSLLLDGNKVNLDTKDIDFTNRLLIISELRKVRSSSFKNIHLRLIDSLISFFERHDTIGGNFQLKIYSFNLIWEYMVESFLNDRFLKIDEKLDIVWSTKKSHNLHFAKKVFYPDIRKQKGYTLEPDHYAILNNNRYIFDAKYYQDLKELDYKQIAYYFLLKHFDTPRDNKGKLLNELKTYNALFLPTEKKEYKEIHFKLNSDYNENEKEFFITAYYLNTINIMKNFIGNF